MSGPNSLTSKAPPFPGGCPRRPRQLAPLLTRQLSVAIRVGGVEGRLSESAPAETAGRPAPVGFSIAAAGASIRVAAPATAAVHSGSRELLGRDAPVTVGISACETTRGTRLQVLDRDAALGFGTVIGCSVCVVRGGARGERGHGEAAGKYAKFHVQLPFLQGSPACTQLVAISVAGLSSRQDAEFARIR